jgi:hypothetical protein
MLTVFWLGNLKGRDHLEDVGADVRVILECILVKLKNRDSSVGIATRLRAGISEY